MNKKINKFTLYILIPTIFNLLISYFVYQYKSPHKFSGYMIGTITSFILSVVWVIQIRMGIKSNALNFLKIMFKSYLVKIVFLIIFLISGYLLFSYDRFYFIFAFFFGTLFSLVIEVLFYYSAGKGGRLIRKSN